jgi:hypothetical protein
MFIDKLILAGTAGLIAAIGDVLFDFLFFWLKIASSTNAHFIANIIFRSPNINVIQVIVGLIAHLIAGAVVGLLPFICYLWSGKKYPLIKGVAIGAGLWLNHVVIVTSFVDQRFHEVPTIPTLFVNLGSLIVWGIVAYGIIAKYGDKIEV